MKLTDLESEIATYSKSHMVMYGRANQNKGTEYSGISSELNFKISSDSIGTGKPNLNYDSLCVDTCNSHLYDQT